LAVTQRTAYLLLAAVVFLWGANWPVMKIGLAFIPPLWFASARMILGALFIFALLAWRRNLALPKRQDLPVLLAVGLLQMGLFLALVNTALQFVEAGRSAVLAYTTPLWVLPGALLFLGERMNQLKLAGFLLGLLGVGLLFNPFGFDWSAGDVVLGNGLLMIAALAWAVTILVIRGHRWAATPLQLAPWQMLLAALPLMILALIFEGPPIGPQSVIRWQPEVWAILLYNGPLATSFPYWATVTISRALPAISASLGFLLVPIFGVISSALWLGESLGVTLLTGLALLLLGLALVAWSDRQKKPRAGDAAPARPS
jgi:drug/metabolite transporter (DMT)-like permease|tara:strand:- start:21189 stop:22130 length:942 start_codon:yes stop_codon:yes gene_type:complete